MTEWQPDLEGLAARVKEANGPSRELDARIWHAMVCRLQDQSITVLLDAGDVRTGRKAWRGYMWEFPLDGAWQDWDGVAAHIGAPHVTASLDAALALVERVLPGWTVGSVGQTDHKEWFAELREGFKTSYVSVARTESRWDGERHRFPSTPALALLSALLAALATTAKPT